MVGEEACEVRLGDTKSLGDIADREPTSKVVVKDGERPLYMNVVVALTRVSGFGIVAGANFGGKIPQQRLQEVVCRSPPRFVVVGVPILEVLEYDTIPSANTTGKGRLVGPAIQHLPKRRSRLRRKEYRVV